MFEQLMQHTANKMQRGRVSVTVLSVTISYELNIIKLSISARDNCHAVVQIKRKYVYTEFK